MIFMLCSGVMEMPAAVKVVSSQISMDSNHDYGYLDMFNRDRECGWAKGIFLVTSVYAVQY